jgi:hypothetical protein
MSVSLSSIWSQVEKLISDGISVIPVRDKDDEAAGRLAKTPFGSWKKYQDKAIDKSELWALMEHHSTEAVGIVCGKVSGNLEAIDIDVKYKNGIDAILFQDIKTIYPDLFSKIRIHKTPSGGFHILYRVLDGVIPGNLKLSGREATDVELEANPKNKTYNFIETRGEGGYVLAPPSLGYTISKDTPIPVLTWDERCSLISLCETYNEVIKIAPTYKPTKSESEYYTENPWDHFNGSCNPVEFLKEFGWEEFKSNGHFIWFTRPGKTKGVSASWNIEKRIFYIFTSSTELESSRGYHPVTVLAELKFAGDKKRTYQHLVANGYGKVKASIEQSVIKKRAISGEPIPNNFSHAAKDQFQEIKVTLQQNHPYGIFWFRDEQDKIKIDREGLYQVAAGLGFRNHNADIVRIEDIFVEKCSARKFFDDIKEYINEEDPDEYTEICNTYESFLQTSGKFTIDRIMLFDNASLLNDTADRSYKFYQNGFIEISVESIIFHTYDLIPDKLIWKHKVFNREWIDTKPTSCVYIEYLKNATGYTDYVKKVIGYLSHDFKSESAGYIIVLSEMVPDPKDGGGSGKNVFGNMLRNTITVSTVPGSMIQFNEKFFQPWNGQRVYFLADIPKKIDWLFLKEMATGNGLLKKLYKDEQEIDSKDMCKLLLNTNYSYDDADGGLKRRIIPIEFSNYYTLNGGIDAVHGKMFPDDFTIEDWIGFDHCIAESIQLLLGDKGKLSPGELSDTGWEKKFKSQYGDSTFEFVQDNINVWREKVFISTKDFTESYHTFCTENDINIKFRAGQKLMNMAIKDYCLKSNIVFHPTYLRKINSIPIRGKLFGEPGSAQPSPSEIDFDNEEPPF